MADNRVKNHRDPARSWLCLLESRVLTARSLMWTSWMSLWDSPELSRLLQAVPTLPGISTKVVGTGWCWLGTRILGPSVNLC